MSGASVFAGAGQIEPRPGELIEVYSVFFARQPDTDRSVRVLVHPSGASFTAAIENAAVPEGSPPPPKWHTVLERLRWPRGVAPPRPRSPEFHHDAMAIWPAPQVAAAFVDPATQDLPGSVVPTVVELAVDLGIDGTADLLALRHCCGDRSRIGHDCEYFCGEYWQRMDGEWTRCSAWTPA